MSRDFKLNKSELTRLRRQQKLYGQYLPVLKLKTEQLQQEMHRINKTIEVALADLSAHSLSLKPFVQFFSDPDGISIRDLALIDQMVCSAKSVAGVRVKTLSSMAFKPVLIPGFQTSLWLRRSVPILHAFLHSEAQVSILREERKTIKRELSKAMQKLNLFELVLIPKTILAIKKIKIALGDEQVASVSRGKIAKLKGEKKGQSLRELL